ncbi:MAG: His/Gly/Thr/Pro-type tRNA ligase C-terminal domain-containing protein, partial [Clostridia bacterium]|nr:His/Gly/Thr/Pro-type tRNA ligase C-terminal domain-containing protein [Clostridia bacterium]
RWDEAQCIMKRLLADNNINYKFGIDEAAFYGPKLDIQIKNVFGKEDTLITIQIDMLLAKKFGMEYVDSDNTLKTPYIIHRTSLGCYERTLALLIEKYAGAMPMFIAPTQVKLLPIGNEHIDYAYEVKQKMQAAGLRVEVDDRNETIGRKIRDARLDKVPYRVVIGDNEVKDGTVSVSGRTEELGTISLDAFIARCQDDVKNLVK